MSGGPVASHAAQRSVECDADADGNGTVRTDERTTDVGQQCSAARGAWSWEKTPRCACVPCIFGRVSAVG